MCPILIFNYTVHFILKFYVVTISNLLSFIHRIYSCSSTSFSHKIIRHVSEIKLKMLTRRVNKLFSTTGHFDYNPQYCFTNSNNKKRISQNERLNFYSVIYVYVSRYIYIQCTIGQKKTYLLF